MLDEVRRRRNDADARVDLSSSPSSCDRAGIVAAGRRCRWTRRVPPAAYAVRRLLYPVAAPPNPLWPPAGKARRLAASPSPLQLPLLLCQLEASVAAAVNLEAPVALGCRSSKGTLKPVKMINTPYVDKKSSLPIKL